MALSKSNYHRTTGIVTQKLMLSLQADASRTAFFHTLSETLQEFFPFDRLCINLYDREGGMLTYFTAAEGTLVSTLSPIRPAETSSTVAGHVIASRKPVIITNFAEYFSELNIHPIAEAGLTSTMAFPLILDNEIFATLHCSFARQPENIYEIASFLADLSPFVAICLGAILAREQFALNWQNVPAPSAPDSLFVYHSRLMRDIIHKLDAVARLNVPVLVLGESGTGKTVIAHEIHRRSPRSKANFVKVSCPSLSPTLFESELFGHAKGAFTGAGAKRTGRLEMAHNGTLFLDEIADLSPEMQSKLLQVLEESSFERVGESMPLAVNVRFVAATHAAVPEAIAGGTLRHDLYYRLAACVLEIPPLRRHREDIPTLASAISRQLSIRLGHPAVKLNRDIIALLMDYDWPGNIRELRNILTRFAVHAGIHKGIGCQDALEILREAGQLEGAGATGRHASPSVSPPPATPPGPVRSGENFTGDSLAEMQKKHILGALQRTGGIIAGSSGAAALLGIPRSTLQHRMRKLGIAGNGRTRT